MSVITFKGNNITIAMNEGSFMILIQVVPQLFYLYGVAYSFGGSTEPPDPSAFPAW